MTNIVVLVKQVPDTYSERKLSEGDHTLDRESADAVIDEINERSVEEALKIKEAGEGEVTVLCVGPDRATDAIRKALSMGADKAIHVSDESLHGSDMVATAKVIAAALGKVEYDLVIAGNEASDGRGGAIPAMLAELLGLPQLTHARQLTVDGGGIKVDRETEEGITHLEASLPAVVSVTEKINEPRYPSFKGIMAAKKKPVETLTVADLGVDAGEVGLGNAWSTVLEASPKPPRTAGQRVEDEGDGGSKVAEYLVGQKLI
ncbi:electron transfer flavoprotein subunit beta/FixA family protein [Prauserella endophytica]|uniref:Electron transfer flavoprotein subunit beta n=1 Tax=Prauserella endophytica TaxID=1592324 RepID=A0ABY2S383_9PSEU|nr:electron transfer flavoprotein subunit beta/FixA family protein [Prauserella endophytica]PXY25079.1 electron transfer flavoprotein subunit beta [Prauserella coralliicola]TKG69160.1 electron transfer flavoprotein subunit beta/FixA family protein [Prauserella endophytica]